MTYITIADVRRACKVPSDTITDDEVTAAIAIVEPLIEHFLNAKFTPTEKIDILSGDGSDRVLLKKNPLLKLKRLEIADTSIDVDDVYVFKGSGFIQLKGSSTKASFPTGTRNVFVKYLHGWLEDTTTTTTTTADASAGSSVAISVSDETDFSVDDWIELIGFDGNQEIAQVTGTATGMITVDELSLDHESESMVIKQQVPFKIKRIMELEGAIYVAVGMIGGTYDFNTSYSLGELTVNKGEPYPQWREVIHRCSGERKRLIAGIRPRPYVR